MLVIFLKKLLIFFFGTSYKREVTYSPVKLEKYRNFPDNCVTFLYSLEENRRLFPTVPQYQHYDTMIHQMTNRRRTLYQNNYFYYKLLKEDIYHKMNGEFYPRFEISHFNQKRIF